jgi:hypothetical protein
MKKLLYLFAFLTVFLSSCSSDNDDSSSLVLLKKYVETLEDGSTFTMNFNYNGNKLLGSTGDFNSSSTVTYNGNLITKIEYFNGSTLTQENIYQYNNNDKLINFKSNEYYSTSGNYGTSVDYTYNSDGTVSFSKYSGDLSLPLTLSSEGYFTFDSHGRVTSAVQDNGYTETFTYDDKNSPFKNILGIDKLPFEGDYANNFINNFIIRTNTYSGSNFTLTYNSNDYLSIEIEDDGDEITTTQYFYN